jgi:hypothetical protein
MKKYWILIAALGLAGCSNALWGVYEPENWAYYCADHHELPPGEAEHADCMNHYYGEWARAELARPALAGYQIPDAPWYGYGYDGYYYPPYLSPVRAGRIVCGPVGGLTVCNSY